MCSKRQVSSTGQFIHRYKRKADTRSWTDRHPLFMDFVYSMPSLKIIRMLSTNLKKITDKIGMDLQKIVCHQTHPGQRSKAEASPPWL